MTNRIENSRCYNCNLEITKNNSSIEHIILNSCGGKLKSSKLICKKCNELFGTNADAELAKQLNSLSSFLNVDRDRHKINRLKGLKMHKIEAIPSCLER
jgi:hypothetical protein